MLIFIFFPWTYLQIPAWKKYKEGYWNYSIFCMDICPQKSMLSFVFAAYTTQFYAFSIGKIEV